MFFEWLGFFSFLLGCNGKGKLIWYLDVVIFVYNCEILDYIKLLFND